LSCGAKRWRSTRPGAGLGQHHAGSGKTLSYKQARGKGGFIRSSWKELNQLIAAANVWTIKNYGPDRVAGFSPIPAMSMVSYAAGTRYLSLLGGTCLSFYDWYCDLPRLADDLGRADRRAGIRRLVQLQLHYRLGLQRPADPNPGRPLLYRSALQGHQNHRHHPDFSEVAKLSDQWLAPKQGTDSALAMAMGHVILKTFHLDNPSDYFLNYCRTYTDMPMLVMLERRDEVSTFPAVCCAPPIWLTGWAKAITRMENRRL
jgi:nitrate reductase alpha subunit